MTRSKTRLNLASAHVPSLNELDKLVVRSSVKQQWVDEQLQIHRRHTAEWNAKTALETQARCTLEDQHERQLALLSLSEIPLVELIAVKDQQRQEVKKLYEAQERVKAALKKKQTQENIDLDKALARKINNTVN